MPLPEEFGSGKFGDGERGLNQLPSVINDESEAADTAAHRTRGQRTAYVGEVTEEGTTEVRWQENGVLLSGAEMRSTGHVTSQSFSLSLGCQDCCHSLIQLTRCLRGQPSFQCTIH